MAEETGLINGLGGLMLRRACVDAALWPDDVSVAVDLSPLQFRVGNLLSVVTDALKQSGLPAKRLELEIAETLLLEKRPPGAGHPACAARARRTHFDGRFRHRLFQPELPRAFPSTS